jgi:hypothetical protein
VVSAAERLAAALGGFEWGYWEDRLFHAPEDSAALAEAILDADPHLAQDIEDGRALRKLREATVENGGREWFIDHTRHGVRLRVWSTGGPGTLAYGVGDDLAAAADAAREALRDA